MISDNGFVVDLRGIWSREFTEGSACSCRALGAMLPLGRIPYCLSVRGSSYLEDRGT